MKINKKFLLCLFWVIPFAKPAEYVFGSLFDSFLDAWKLFSSLSILYVYIKQAKLSAVILLTILFQGTGFASTIINGAADLRSQLILFLSNAAFAMIVETGIRKYKDCFLSAIAFYGSFLSVITALTMFVCYPEGMDQGEFMDILGDVNFYFLGQDNGSFFVVFAFQIYTFVYALNKYKKIPAYIALIYIFVDAAYIYVNSAAAVAAIVLFWIYIVFLHKRNNTKIMNFNVYITMCLIFFITVVMLRMHELFPYIVQNIFHKSMTLSNRTVLWDIAIAYIKKSFVFGYGNEGLEAMMQKFGINHIHNIVLDITYQSGIIGMAIYTVLIAFSGRQLMKFRSNSTAKFVSFSLFLYFLISMFDYYNSKYVMYGVIILAYNISYLVPDNEKSETLANGVAVK